MSHRPLRLRLTVVLTTGASLLVAAPASAKEILVGGGAACPGADYSTVQAAVDAASPHDAIRVCPGTYVEQVTIPAGKDGLSLRSTEPLAAVIKAPAQMADPGDLVRISASRDVTLEGFTISGPLPDALFCSSDTFKRAGVGVDSGGSATIRANHVAQIRSVDSTYRGCQSGAAILIGTLAGGTGTAFVAGNTIDSYQKAGVFVEGAGSSAVVAWNVVTGDGPNPIMAQNGIEVDYGADAEVRGNRVSGQVYAPSPLASGILFFQSGRATAIGNEVEKSDYGVFAVDAAAPVIQENIVSRCTANGIALDQYLTGTSGGNVARNSSRDNGGDGLFVSKLSLGNKIRHNVLLGDKGFDAEDDSSGSGTAGTGNTWRRDICKTDNKGGQLCDSQWDDDAEP